MARQFRLVATALAGLFVALVPATAMELVLVEQPGCIYCQRWDDEIAPAYPRTAEGAFAPLRRVQLRALPDDVDFASRPILTPTFVLVDAGGVEMGRIEGYPGDQFFWPLLSEILLKAGFRPEPAK